MQTAGPFVLLVGGGILLVGGLLLLSRSLRRLRRSGAFHALFWISFRHFAVYRMRSLGSFAGVALGILLAGSGLVALYLGITAFYGSRFGGFGG